MPFGFSFLHLLCCRHHLKSSSYKGKKQDLHNRLIVFCFSRITEGEKSIFACCAKAGRLPNEITALKRKIEKVQFQSLQTVLKKVGIG